MKVAIGQINTTVGDIEGNASRTIGQIRAARAAGAGLVVFPELAMFGYPPKDLLLRRDMVTANMTALDRVARECTGITAVVGYVRVDPSGSGKGIFNAAAVCGGGKIIASYDKMLLPTYDVFDETRYFSSGSEVRTVSVPVGGGSIRLGLTICEDLWNDEQFEGRRVYGIDPVERTVKAGAELLVNISASPFAAGKRDNREAIFRQQIREHGVPLISVNLVGGNDDIIFDGASLVMDATGKIIARAGAFREDTVLVDLSAPDPRAVTPYPDRVEMIRQAIVLGVRDYLGKCGFQKVIIGLSGGIDSALTAALAVEALDKDRVVGVAMPSRYSSDHSVEDAQELADNLGIEMMTIPIESVHLAMEEAMAPYFADLPPGIAEENIQARIRGNILMAMSNKFGWLLLTTGNKSELAVGYCTLYGDMCGGLAVISDVPKTVAYEMARLINKTAGGPCIPVRTIEKEPSAELKEDQRDQDTLPPYDILDKILEQYVEQDQSVDEIVAMGFERQTVKQVTQLVDRNEYKRKQAPVGLKVTSRAFGTGRRMPIAAKRG